MWRHPVNEFWELGYVDQNSLNWNFDISNRMVTSWANTTCSQTRLSHACARCWWKSSSNTEHVNNHVFRSGKFTQSVPRLFLTSISNSGWSAKQEKWSSTRRMKSNSVLVWSCNLGRKLIANTLTDLAHLEFIQAVPHPAFYRQLARSRVSSDTHSFACAW